MLFWLFLAIVLCAGFTRLCYTRPSNKPMEDLFDRGTFFYCFCKYRNLYLYVALLWMFVQSVSLSAFIVILGDFCEAKFIRGTSLIFPIVIWSYVTPFFNWRQKDEWNSLEGSWTPYPVGKAIAIRHNGEKENDAFNKTLICD